MDGRPKGRDARAVVVVVVVVVRARERRRGVGGLLTKRIGAREGRGVVVVVGVVQRPVAPGGPQLVQRGTR